MADDGGRGFLKHFLVSPLERAIALPQMDRVAIAIAKYLKFNVARIAEIFFKINRRIAERGLGLGACLEHLRFKLFGRIDDLHAAPTAA